MADGAIHFREILMLKQSSIRNGSVNLCNGSVMGAPSAATKIKSNFVISNIIIIMSCVRELKRRIRVSLKLATCSRASAGNGALKPLSIRLVGNTLQLVNVECGSRCNFGNRLRAYARNLIEIETKS